MNNIEEILWNYIDGNCSIDEQKTIRSLIEQDNDYRLKYQELLNLNKEFKSFEIEHPPMAFTYNVIEAIRSEHAHVPLKATINKRIIIGIATFFVCIILGLVVYTFANIDWLTTGSVVVNFSTGLKLPEIKNYITGPVLQGFLFFDIVLALYLFDAYLSKKGLPKQV